MCIRDSLKAKLDYQEHRCLNNLAETVTWRHLDQVAKQGYTEELRLTDPSGESSGATKTSVLEDDFLLAMNLMKSKPNSFLRAMRMRFSELFFPLRRTSAPTRT